MRLRRRPVVPGVVGDRPGPAEVAEAGEHRVGRDDGGPLEAEAPGGAAQRPLVRGGVAAGGGGIDGSARRSRSGSWSAEPGVRPRRRAPAGSRQRAARFRGGLHQSRVVRADARAARRRAGPPASRARAPRPRPSSSGTARTRRRFPRSCGTYAPATGCLPARASLPPPAPLFRQRFLGDAHRPIGHRAPRPPDGHPQDAAFAGVRWVLVARAAGEVLAFAAAVSLARLITPAEFGRAAVALALVPLAVILTFEGCASALVQRPTITHAQTRRGDPHEPWRRRVLSLLSFALAQSRRRSALRRSHRRFDRARLAGLPARERRRRPAGDAVAPARLQARQRGRGREPDGGRRRVGGPRGRRASTPRRSSPARSRRRPSPPSLLFVASPFRPRLLRRRDARRRHRGLRGPGRAGGARARRLRERGLRDPRRPPVAHQRRAVLARVPARRHLPGEDQRDHAAARLPGLRPHDAIATSCGGCTSARPACTRPRCCPCSRC